MIELWKRKENEIAHIWNMKGYKGNDEERKDYKYYYVPHKRQVAKKSFQNSYNRRVFAELPTVILSITATVVCYACIRYYRLTHTQDKYASVKSSIMNSVVMMVLMALYKTISKSVVNWENHRF